jgi:hypothetical protein
MSKLTREDLAQFTGTSQRFRHALMRNVTYTEGVQYLAERAGAYWLIDKVAILQLEPKVKPEEFQVWKLRVADDKATLTCEDGNDNEVYRESITFTDFPLVEIDLWFENNVIMLPSER